jgi:hypothetical protein
MKHLRLFENDAAKGILENVYLLSNKLFLLNDEGVIKADGTTYTATSQTLETINSILTANSYPKYKSLDGLKKDVESLKLACKMFAEIKPES